jgi:hypothetical protein
MRTWVAPTSFFDLMVKMIFIMDLVRHTPSLTQAGAGDNDMKSDAVATRQ